MHRARGGCCLPSKGPLSISSGSWQSSLRDRLHRKDPAWHLPACEPGPGGERQEGIKGGKSVTAGTADRQLSPKRALDIFHFVPFCCPGSVAASPGTDSPSPHLRTPLKSFRVLLAAVFQFFPGGFRRVIFARSCPRRGGGC